MRLFAFFLSLFLVSTGFSQDNSNPEEPDVTPPAQVKKSTPPPSPSSEKNNPAPQNPASQKPKAQDESPETVNPSLQNYFNNNSSSTPENQASVAPLSPQVNLPSAWGPFLFLLILILVVYAVIRFVRRRIQLLKISENPIDFIRTLAKIPLTPHIQMVLVDIGGKYYLLSAGTHSAELLMEIVDEDLILKIQSIPLGGNPRRFSEIFLELLGIRSAKKISSVESENKLKQFIETQKDRIGKM